MPHNALVLSGGGARGAYQAGVLQGLVDLGLLRDRSPFQILVGASAGSINVALLGAYADRVSEGVAEMTRVWGRIRVRQVFRTDLVALSRIAAQWVRDLTFGGLMRDVAPKALLDTEPLPHLLQQIPLYRLKQHVEAGILEALAVAATDYYSSEGVLFVEGRPDMPTWKRARVHVERTPITIRHLMASSAIPFFFPTVEIKGRHFGDGCIRNTAPLAPAIHLGADRILAVGVREASWSSPPPEPHRRAPRPAHISGVLLDAVMLDAVEVDVDHCLRINESVKSGSTGFRHVEVVWLSPSRAVGPLVHEMSHRIPWPIRYLLAGLGSEDATTELTSYLLFHQDFTRKLMELGRSDVLAQEERLRAFFNGEKVSAPARAQRRA